MENPAPNKNRKSTFSISFFPDDFDEILVFLEKMNDETGISLSRNELIRRSVLAHVRFNSQPCTEENQPKVFIDRPPFGGKSYSQVFIDTGRSLK